MTYTQLFGILSMLVILACVVIGITACHARFQTAMDRVDATNCIDAIYTVSGILKNFIPAVNRPGCILELTNGKTTGKYYVPLSPHDVRTEYPDGSTVRLMLDGSPASKDGIYETIGNHERLWTTTKT